MNRFLHGLALASAAIALPFAASAQEVGENELKVALSQHDGTEILATVGEDRVTLADAAMIYSTLPADVHSVPAEQLLGGITEQLVSETALYRKALDEKLDQTREMQFRLAAIRRSALAEAYLSKAIEARVTEDSLREQYEAVVKGFEGEDEVRARHILVESEDEAKAIAKELEDGANFAKLAAEKSTGPSGANGGDLGWFVKTDMVGPFAEAAFATEPGKISAPVKTQFGWHVLKVEERRKQTPPPFETLEPQLRSQASQQVAQQIIDEVRAEAEIEMSEEMPPAFLVRRPEVYSD